MGARFTEGGELSVRGETLRPRPQTRQWGCEQSASERRRAPAGSEVLLCALRRLNEESEVEAAFSGERRKGRCNPHTYAFVLKGFPVLPQMR